MPLAADRDGMRPGSGDHGCRIQDRCLRVQSKIRRRLRSAVQHRSPGSGAQRAPETPGLSGGNSEAEGIRR